jgi:cation:H+ antiporter
VPGPVWRAGRTHLSHNTADDPLTIAILLIAGAALLVLGAEILVRGATMIAAAAGIRPLIIGLTVVAFGTSAPELAVSLGATFSGQPDIAMGNVVGSNIFNVLFILGVSALIVPLAVQKQVVRLELPIMLGVSIVLMIVSLDGVVGRLDGVLLFGGLIAYLIYLARTGGVSVPSVESGGLASDSSNGDPTAGLAGQDEPETSGTTATVSRGAKKIAGAALLAVVGLLLLVAGSRFFVDGAVALATLLGVSQTIIGLTIIAAGTSLPELATSILAGIRGERDIAVGNVVGSNIFNILAILGLCGLLGPEGVEVNASMLRFDLPIMIAVAVLTLPVFFTGFRIGRLEGLLFLSFYLAYTAFLILQATRHDALDEFSGIMLLFVAPLTAIGLLWSVRRTRNPSC